MPTIYMARQPIFDRRQKVVAYELLFRRGETGFAGDLTEGDSAQAIINAVIDIGLPQLAGQSKAFINVSEQLLLTGALHMLPAKKVVLEILETVPPTTMVIAEMKRLQRMGYTLALDDFILRPDLAPMLPLAKVIKLDVMGVKPSDLKRQVAKLKNPQVKLLAEKVETHEEFQLCKSLGFEMFQGYFFSKPQVLAAHMIPPNKLALVNLISKLHTPEVSFAEIEALISSEIALSYRLLKFIKSAHFGVPSKVDSIRQSLLFVGVRTVAALATLLAMSDMASDKEGLVGLGMARAKMCEQLAELQGIPDKDRFFSVGLLSVLDALLDTPMKAILDELPLSEEMNVALLDPSAPNDLAEVLRCAIAYERGDWEHAALEGLCAKDLDFVYRSSVAWTHEAYGEIAA